jgi:hypothetical protein
MKKAFVFFASSCALFGTASDAATRETQTGKTSQSDPIAHESLSTPRHSFIGWPHGCDVDPD